MNDISQNELDDFLVEDSMERNCSNCAWCEHCCGEGLCGRCKIMGRDMAWAEQGTLVTLPRERLREIIIAARVDRAENLENEDSCCAIYLTGESDDEYADRILAELDKEAKR
jgi:hypothetical protein